MVSVPRSRTDERTLVSRLALTVGTVFLVVGIAGFIPGITTNYDSLSFAGHHSGAMLFGLAGIAMARRADTARLYLIGGGAVYLVLWLYGLVIGDTSAANFVPVNTADDWLHFLLGVGMIGLGLLATRRSAIGRR